VGADYDAGEFFVAKRDQNARAHGRLRFAHRIGEDAVERNRQSYIAELGHGR
jgi:hypothetical protein